MEDAPRLFKGIDPGIHARVFARLLRMRQEHPSYRDDQLLMFMLCQAETPGAPKKPTIRRRTPK